MPATVPKSRLMTGTDVRWPALSRIVAAIRRHTSRAVYLASATPVVSLLPLLPLTLPSHPPDLSVQLPPDRLGSTRAPTTTSSYSNVVCSFVVGSSRRRRSRRSRATIPPLLPSPPRERRILAARRVCKDDGISVSIVCICDGALHLRRTSLFRLPSPPRPPSPPLRAPFGWPCDPYVYVCAHVYLSRSNHYPRFIVIVRYWTREHL